MSSTTTFGQWYDNKKSQDGGNGGASAETSSSSWFGGFDSESVLPLFNNETMQSLSWNNMKASMEAQMPKQILGMGYQQRFQVFCALLFLSALFFTLAFFIGMPALVARPQKFAISFTMGSLTFMASFGILKGPMEHLKSGASGYLLVLSASAAQLLALLYYLISFLPGGAAGLKYVLAAMAHILKPVIRACARMQALCLQRWAVWLARGGNSG
ncbi:hypothetical protein ACA910_019954 [Epithemia clementina (nom. ined.)]